MTYPRFTVRDLLLVMLAVGIGLAWWLDRRQLAGELSSLQHASAMNASRPLRSQFGGAGRPVQRPVSTLSADELIRAIHKPNTWREFEDQIAEPFVRTAAADEALPALILLLQSPDETVRTRAIATLGKMNRHAEATVPAIIPLLDDVAPNVRWHAAFALGLFGHKGRPAIEALRKQMDDPTSPIAASSATALARIDPSFEADPVLAALVSNPLLVNRKQAVVDLAATKTNSPQVKAAVVEAFGRETDADTRDRMAQLIANITARQQPAPIETAEAAPNFEAKPINVELHGGLEQKDQRRLHAMVKALNSIEGVAVNIRGSESGDPVTEATVRDPHRLLSREATEMIGVSDIQTTIIGALRAGGVTTVHWKEAESEVD